MGTDGIIEVVSGLELRVAEQLNDLVGEDWEYERESYTWWEEYRHAFCGDCGSTKVLQQRSYTPDFFLANGVVIEVKGRLTRRDRKILIGVRKANTDLDLRLIFDKNNRIHKRAKSRCSDWAERYNFQFSLKGVVPEEWTKE